MNNSPIICEEELLLAILRMMPEEYTNLIDQEDDE